MSKRGLSGSRLALSSASPMRRSSVANGDGCHVAASNLSPPTLARHDHRSPSCLASKETSGLSSARRNEPVISAMAIRDFERLKTLLVPVFAQRARMPPAFRHRHVNAFLGVALAHVGDRAFGHPLLMRFGHALYLHRPRHEYQTLFGDAAILVGKVRQRAVEVFCSHFGITIA